MPRLAPHETRELIYSILTQTSASASRPNWEIDFSYSVPGRARFRVNAYFQRATLGAAFRLVPINIKTLEELGLPKSLHAWVNKPRGLVLVTGPTGSGKSTTLASMIDEINETRAVPHHDDRGPHRVPAPPQASRWSTSARWVRTRKSFTSALRSVLRQDPDVILVGEMRDLETIQIAMTAAETGHLVFATLHTADAPQTIDRIIDVFPPHQQEQIRVHARQLASGCVLSAAAPDRRWHAAVPSSARCSTRRRPSAT